MAFADSQSGAVVSGESPAQIRIVGAVTKGDAIGFSGGWKRALATVATAIPCHCVAAEDGVDDQIITAYFGRTVIEGDRITGATVGGAVYVAEGTSNGMWTQTAPSTTGDVNNILGYALTATTLVITPSGTSDTIA